MFSAIRKFGRLTRSSIIRMRPSLPMKKRPGSPQRWWQKLWSLRGAGFAIAVAGVVSIIQLLVAVHGKLVILPFEVRSDQSTPAELGASFAQSLSIALNEYRELFPSKKPDDQRYVVTSKNYADLIQFFMAKLPYVEIPRTSPLNKGATVLEAIKLGPVSIPVSQLVFENLAFFHEDTLRGSLEIWGNSLVAKFSLGGGEKTIAISASKEQGYQFLIRRAAVELLQEKKWIEPMPMKLSALPMFKDGLRNYLDFDTFAEDRFIEAARENYSAALQADSSADLARLHLGTAEYVSTEPATIAKAIENFSLLLGGGQYVRAARIGYVASVLRYINREGSCDGIYRYLSPAFQVVRSWQKSDEPPSEIDELLLWSTAFRRAASFLFPDKSCATWVRSLVGEDDIAKVFGKARAGYDKALKQIAEPNRYAEGDVTRYRFYILLNTKYLLDDMVDYSILTKHPDSKVANVALELGAEIQRQRDKLPVERQRFFAQSIAGSVADSYLRLARIKEKESDPAETMRLVSAAVDQLRIAQRSSEPPTVQWALFRLADLELGRADASASLGWLMKAYNGLPSFPGAFDESYFPFGMLIEKPARRCEAIDLFKKGSAAGSVASKLLLADALRRQGNGSAALAVTVELRASIDSSTQWTGGAIGQKLSFLEAKLKPKNRKSLDLKALLQQLGHHDAGKEFLKFDIFELAEIAKDEKLLTTLKGEILFPAYYQPKIVRRNC